jgi:S1-C subfamily serine protease
MNALRHSWLSFVLLGSLFLLVALSFRDPAQAQLPAPAPSVPRADVQPAEPLPPSLPTGLSPDELSNINIFETSSPSVVHIQSTATVRRDMFSMNVTRIPAGSGTGFIWDQQGHIVTNFHVVQQQIEDARFSLEVILNDQSSWAAEVVGHEPDKDVAVLKIKAPAEKLRPLKLGTSTDLRVGQRVLAIGNPFGLDQTLTTGVISGLGREIESVSGRTIQGVIQTDAAINPGNSGGPLLDSSGRLIGVNTAIYSPSGAYAGVGFAVPADEVNRVVPQLIEFGRVIRPVLGITLADDAILRRIGGEGALVINVQPGSGAQKAGLQPTTRDNRGRVNLGDIIVRVDDKEIADSNDLFTVLDRKAIGDTVKVTVIRRGKEVTVPITLSASK